MPDPLPARWLSHGRLLVTVLVLGGAGLWAQSRQDLSLLVGQTFAGTVTSVVDGDTVHVTLVGGQAVTIRLDGIDSPEKGEPFSAQARNATRVMLFDKRVRVTGTDVDRYGRLVARVVGVEGLDSSLELVRSGLACHFLRYSSDSALAAAQVDARASGRGFWAPGALKPACVAVSEQARRPGAVTGPFHGNARSHVYHAPSCPNYHCKSCSVVFQTADEAKAAGFRPAGDCLR